MTERQKPIGPKSDDSEVSGADRLPLIVTKLRRPRKRDDVLPRRRLIDFLHDHLDRKLLLISAPAGYGKTTLLVDFANDTELPVCWYTLDSFDRDLRLFLEYLIESIAESFPAFGRRSRALLRQTADPGAHLYPLAATLVQEIYDTIPEYFFIVLDDYHAIDEQEQISEFLDLFVSYVDENCHLILTSRTLPALPNLSLLVARRQAAGLGIDELRFTPTEIQALARQNYELELSNEQARQLADQTGGWITGLLLTTVHRWEKAQSDLNTRGRINVDLYDYLSCQVLERQPQALRQFLLDSSVLDEINRDLCISVLGIEQPEPLLDQLRTRNLFVAEFEGEQRQIRYHGLFKTFLRDTLRAQEKARYRDLMLRAADAYAARGEWERAVSRYLDLGAYGPVADIVRRKAREFYDLGRWDTLADWIDLLRRNAAPVAPKLLIHRSKIHGERGEYDRALALLEEAEEAFEDEGDRAGRAHALAMKGYVLRFQGSYALAIERCEEALSLVSGATHDEQMPMAHAYRNVGLCRFRQGQLAQGREALEQALELYRLLDVPYEIGMVHHDLGLGHELMGDLDGAVAQYRAALQRWRQLGCPGPWANTLNGLGVIHALQGDYDQAAQTLEEALAKSREAGDLRVEAFVWASLGDLHRDRGLYERAGQAYHQALDVADQARVGFVVAYALNALGNLARLQGDRALAGRQLLKAMGLATDHGSAYEIGLCHTSLGILQSDAGELVRAREHLDTAVDLFEKGGYKRDAALAHLYRAHVDHLSGEGAGAVAHLERALGLADQLGFDHFLVIEGRWVTPLLVYGRDQGVYNGYLQPLLDRIESHQARIAAHTPPTVEVRAEPVLRILALGVPEVTLDGKAVQWPTIQSRDLFFCVLQHPQGLRKEEIGAIFWPDHPPRRLDGIFRSTLYRLRRAVFRDVVFYEDGVYRFTQDDGYWFDVAVFDRLVDEAGRARTSESAIELLTEAVGLYRGDYLEDVYDDWCLPERERLRELSIDTLQSLASLHQDRGEFQQAIERYHEILALDAYREVAHQGLMLCHYRLGDRVAAIRQYQDCAELLRQDLGLSPAPETEALYKRILG